MSEKAIEKTGQGLVILFIVIMFLRINSYFMVSESPAITRIFKTGLRSLLTGISFLMVIRMQQNSPFPTKFAYRNILAFLFYLNYLFLGIASVMWSTDSGWSMLQLAMDFECVFFVLFYWQAYLVFRHQQRFTRPLHFGHINWVSISLVCFYFLLGAIFNPDMFFRGTHGGEVQRLGGWVINPNELGMLCVVGCGCLYAHMRIRGMSFWHILAWIIMVVALLLTQSRSSLVSFFLVTVYFVMVSGKPQLILSTMGAGALVAPIIFTTVFVKDGDVGEVASMTGRLPFWKDLLTYGFPERPIYGFGFMRIHYHLRFPSIHAFPGAMTHNTFMQLLLNLGILGAITCGMQVMLTFRGFARERDREKFHLGIGILIGVLINSFTEFGIFGDANYGIMYWLFLVMLFMLDTTDQKTAPKNYFFYVRRPTAKNGSTSDHF
ncbi:MAG: O-antigen ligase family protein [Bacteroidota bacterium]